MNCSSLMKQVPGLKAPLDLSSLSLKFWDGYNGGWHAKQGFRGSPERKGKCEKCIKENGITRMPNGDPPPGCTTLTSIGMSLQ